MQLLEQTFFNNTVAKWAIALLIAAAVFAILRIIKTVLSRRLHKLAKKTESDIDDFFADLIKRIKIFFLLILAIYIGSITLSLPKTLSNVIGKLVIIALLWQGAVWGSGTISFWISRYKKRKTEEDAATGKTFTALGFVLRLVLWSVILLLAFDNLGVDITALVAGLGIGGIALALAAQNILGDLFASLSIIFDKPFVIGDFIIVDNFSGTVEYIGLKTTRVRSLSGEQLIFSNSDLLKSRIRNFKRMIERRIVFSLGVIYQTSYEKLARIPGILKEVIDAREGARFDRAHFKAYGPYSLDFEIVYWVLSPDYATYMNIQQDVNLEIYRRFQKEGIEFAYPTQLLYLAKENSS